MDPAYILTFSCEKIFKPRNRLTFLHFHEKTFKKVVYSEQIGLAKTPVDSSGPGNNKSEPFRG